MRRLRGVTLPDAEDGVRKGGGMRGKGARAAYEKLRLTFHTPQEKGLHRENEGNPNEAKKGTRISWGHSTKRRDDTSKKDMARKRGRERTKRV